QRPGGRYPPDRVGDEPPPAAPVRGGPAHPGRPRAPLSTAREAASGRCRNGGTSPPHPGTPTPPRTPLTSLVPVPGPRPAPHRAGPTGTTPPAGHGPGRSRVPPRRPPAPAHPAAAWGR